MTATANRRYIRPMAKPAPLGTRGEAQTTVEFTKTLTAWKEHLPPVYSTPNMIGMMEAAAYNALEPYCEGDEVSVGTAINIVHRAPAVVGQTIKTEAVLESFDGRFYIFKVSASNGNEVIGYGTIGRAIVSKAKFEEKQRQKAAAARD
jgi:fluoroacetyl-CoA thioesterase